MAGRTRWVITLSGRRPLAAVRRDVEEAGFGIDQALEAIGVITGRCDEATVSKVRRIDGVDDVSPDQRIDIGPPGGPDTW
ncbi:MAG: hypothetical protein M3Q19_08475 [Pseudomonadota bacterium]|nr:hypothetical protein [Pseudomonadota bacterium]